jgi:hypothetical protein
MEENRKLALIVSYYLSKYNRKALNNLGYSTFSQAFEDIGAKLNVRPTSIKNMREEFDPLHPNGRVGWYQRELRPSRFEVVENYSHLSEIALTDIVKEILNKYQTAPNNLNLYTTILDNIENDIFVNDEGSGNKSKYTTRGITGNKAEEIFVEAFNNGNIQGYFGNLIDTRNDGCGYDFELEGQNIVFEVKGLLDEKGSISLTDKEWNVSSELGENYILVLISNIKDTPRINIYKNPYKFLTAEKRTTKVIAINWSVPSNQLFK